MSQLDALNQQHAIPDRLRFETGEGGLSRAVLTRDGAEAHVYLHGAHTTHYQPAGAKPVLFMSGASHFAEDQPIRGGVPICFPWFGPKSDDPDAPAHGLARTRGWAIASTHADTAATTIELHNSTITPFDATLRVELGTDLRLTLSVQNRGDADVSFQEALHTYLALSDINNVYIIGLEDAAYIDKMRDAEQFAPTGEPIRFTAETDRVYINTAATCTLHDPGLSRRIVIEKTHSSDTVIWNPWIDKAARMPDFGDDEWPGMCCIETANVHDGGITLRAGETHQMSATIRVE